MMHEFETQNTTAIIRVTINFLGETTDRDSETALVTHAAVLL